MAPPLEKWRNLKDYLFFLRENFDFFQKKTHFAMRFNLNYKSISSLVQIALHGFFYGDFPGGYGGFVVHGHGREGLPFGRGIRKQTVFSGGYHWQVGRLNTHFPVEDLKAYLYFSVLLINSFDSFQILFQYQINLWLLQILPLEMLTRSQATFTKSLIVLVLIIPWPHDPETQ